MRPAGLSPTSHRRLTGRLVACTVALMTVGLLSNPSAHAMDGVRTTAIDLGGSYAYKVVDAGAEAGFEAPLTDDSSWAQGNAPFGTTNGPCAVNTLTNINTIWPVNTDLLVRGQFRLPAGAHDLHVAGTVDNDATVHVNGHEIGHVESADCASPNIDFTAPDSTLLTGDNLIAVRGHDYGIATYLDLRVTFSAPLYDKGLLYDADKAHKSGAAAPLKLQLDDSAGNNMSDPAIVLKATELQKVDGTASGAIADTGNANPDHDFRYDPDLSNDGGYIFNKSTKGLSAGARP